MLLPKLSTLLRRFFSKESTAAKTEIKQSIAIEIPNKERKALNLLLSNSLMARIMLSIDILSQTKA